MVARSDLGRATRCPQASVGNDGGCFSHGIQFPTQSATTIIAICAKPRRTCQWVAKVRPSRGTSFTHMWRLAQYSTTSVMAVAIPANRRVFEQQALHPPGFLPHHWRTPKTSRRPKTGGTMGSNQAGSVKCAMPTLRKKSPSPVAAACLARVYSLTKINPLNTELFAV